jgi:hypothetical protein
VELRVVGEMVDRFELGFGKMMVAMDLREEKAINGEFSSPTPVRSALSARIID